jgi:hypothetical protein
VSSGASASGAESGVTMGRAIAADRAGARAVAIGKAVAGAGVVG